MPRWSSGPLDVSYSSTCWFDALAAPALRDSSPPAAPLVPCALAASHPVASSSKDEGSVAPLLSLPSSRSLPCGWQQRMEVAALLRAGGGGWKRQRFATMTRCRGLDSSLPLPAMRWWRSPGLNSSLPATRW
jgi:hypothetical protein